jgi:hypothetical protein
VNPIVSCSLNFSPSEFLQESDNYINELLENELLLRAEIEALKGQHQSDREIIDILKEINEDQKEVIAELEDSVYFLLLHFLHDSYSVGIQPPILIAVEIERKRWLQA